MGLKIQAPKESISQMNQHSPSLMEGDENRSLRVNNPLIGKQITRKISSRKSEGDKEESPMPTEMENDENELGLMSKYHSKTLKQKNVGDI